MIKQLVVESCKAAIFGVVLLASAVAFPQCTLVTNNPPCNPVSVNLTAASVTAGTATIGTLTYWLNPNATVPLPTPAAVTSSGLYYIKNTVGSCSDIKPVTVTIGTTAPTSTPFLNVECSAAQTTANSIFFDFNGVGQTSFNWSYTVDGGPPITGSQTAPTSYTVTGLSPGQKVVFTISFVGVCTPPLTKTAYPKTNLSFNLTNNAHMCLGDALPTTDLNGMPGVWNEPVITSINGNPSNYIFTPPGCAMPITYTFYNDPRIIPTFNAIGPYCQGSTPTPNPLATTSNNGITGTWKQGTTPVTTINTSAVGTLPYTFTPNTGQCADPVTFNVQINPTSTATFASIPAQLCQNASYTLPSTATGGITGSWSPSATVNTATPGTKNFTFTPTAGQPCVSTTPVNVAIQVNPTTTPVFNGLATSYCQNAVPASNALPTTSDNSITGTWKQGTTNVTTVNTSTVGSFLYTFVPNPAAFPCAPSINVTIVVSAPIVPTFAASYPSSYCQNAIAQPLPTPNNGITGTWNPPTIDTSTPGTKSSTFTPTAGQCASSVTFTTVVNQPVTIVFNGRLGSDFSICESETPPVLPVSSNNPTPITGTWSPSSINMSAIGPSVYVFTANAGQCVASTSYQITVTVTQQTTPVYSVDSFCEGSAPAQGLALPTNLGGVIGTWSPSGVINNSAFGNYPYTFFPAANQCSKSLTINVQIQQKDVPVFANQQIAPFCAGTTPVPALPATSDNGITGTWSPAVIDNMTTPQTTYTFIPDAGQCAANGSMTVIVDAPVNPGFGNIILCEDTPASDVPDLENVSPVGINGTWNPAAIDLALLGTNQYVFTPDAGECAVPQSIDVTINELTLTDVTWVVSNYFADAATVTFTAIDAGNYLYQLDSGPVYQSNVFHDVSPGAHSITVYDANNCAPPITKPNEVIVVGYPHFFTPNGDGIGDFWNITDLLLVNQPQATIFIFDRYGKLLKQLVPASDTGWDGTYNGNPLPSADYWFVVKYQESGKPREFKSHFSLKR